MALLWAGLRLFGLSMRVWLAPMTFGNTGNLGLPVAFYAYGEVGLALAMIVFAGMILVSFTLGLWVVTGGGSPREALRQPLLHAVAVGLVFGVLQIPVPTVAMRAVELIGQIAIPLMLLTLGVSVARLSPSGMGFAGLLSLLRLVPCGVAALGAAAVFGLDEAARNILILQAIMPAAVTSYLMAERYGAQPEKIAGLVVVSNALSAAYLPVALLILLGL